MTAGLLFGVFSAAFLSATLLVGVSEAALVLAAGQPDARLFELFLAATIGNVLGAIVNFALGRFLLRFEHRRWFPVGPANRQRAEVLFGRYGRPVLLFSWLPVIGDPLTLAAGLLRTPFPVFLLYVTIGKAARYAMLLWAYTALAG
ncbi:membrane protein YqaA with SNARE-associated domain [Rhizobium herbae]|uniref:Membrane protein YqaA with SNARE-associated domain n=1 Tax=Rhizobium herbae TaxID=508661 RepID=A0ABS4EIS3_9HYPH|nr:YqaA family protein [Rhizobium herbae]MBP1857842.1 membrane protein YqaA with SNARE-associated domain [Rhizobium herbae]